MKLFFVVGERSGDLHAGNLIHSLKKREPSIHCLGFGGDQMADRGGEILCHYSEYSVMGFWEVITNLGKIKKYINKCRQQILETSPDAVVLVDFAGFNLKIASFAKKKGIKVIWYISPKVWAWNTKRANKLKRLVDHMMVILPFEKEFYAKYNWEVDYVGNPVCDAVKSYEFETEKFNTSPATRTVALLPGSRKQELVNISGLFEALISSNPQYQFLLAKVDNLPDPLYQNMLSYTNVKAVSGKTYDLLHQSDAAVVTSGTATLETALLGTPQVVVYKTSSLSYNIAKNLIKVPYISLVNLINNKETVKELIQSDANLEKLNDELNKLLTNKEYIESIHSDYNDLKQTLGTTSASDAVAQSVLNFLNK